MNQSAPIGTAWLFALPTLIWGSTWLAITGQLGTVHAAVSVTYRFALAAMLIVVICRWRGESLRFAGKQHAWFAAMGATFFGLNYVAVYRAEELLPSGLVAVLFSTMVFMSPVGMRLAFGTAITLRILLAATLGVAGLALLFLPELRAAGTPGAIASGMALALLAPFLCTFGNLIAVRNHQRSIAIFPATAWGMAYGAASAAVYAGVDGAVWSFDTRPAYLLSLLYLALFGSVIAFGAYLTLLQRVGASASSFISVATPVLAMLLTTVYEGYQWTAIAVLGVVLAVAGNALALWPTAPKASLEA